MEDAPIFSDQQQKRQREMVFPNITCTAEILDVDKLDVTLLENCIHRFSEYNPVLRTVVCIGNRGKLRRYLTHDLSLHIPSKTCEMHDTTSVAVGSYVQSADSKKHCVAVTLRTTNKGTQVLEFSASRLICDESYVEDCMDKILAFYESANLVLSGTAKTIDKQETILEGCNDGYWSEVLNSADVRINLVSEAQKVPLKTIQTDIFFFRFDTELVHKLETLCQQCNIHPSIAFLSLFEALLYRYGHQEHFCIITSLRETPSELTGNEPLLQTCINCNINEDTTFIQLLHDSKANIVQALQNGDYLCSHAASETAIGLLQRLPHFYYRKSSTSAVLDGSVINKSYNIIRDPPTSGIVLKITKSNAYYMCTIEYNTSVTKKETIIRMAGHLQKLLQGVVNNSESKLSTLPLLMPKELDELEHWNKTNIPEHIECCRIEEAFELVVGKAPEAIALCCNDDKITYECLNTYSICLSECLTSKIQKSGIVAICMNKSIDLAVSLLAVIKAGHTYLLIDSEYPQSRIQSILDEATPNVVIVDKDSKSCIPKRFNTLVFSNELLTRKKLKNQATSRVNLNPESVAYLLYTSGTSGTPKGVVVEHCAVLALIHALEKILSPTDIKGVLISSAVSFTLFSGQLFLALLTGNKGIIVPNLLHVPHILFKHEITLISTPPAGLTPILTEKDLPSCVRCIILGGDHISPEVIESVRKLHRDPQIKLISTHGCSENVLFDAFCVVDNSDGDVPVGQPMPNNKLYIVDKLLQLVPVGITGELCISGPQLARGYFKNPGLTCERFLLNPFENTGDIKYNRLYRTGDLACRRDDGKIDIVGRMDFQVKINGIRVELEEISNILMQQPSVEKAVVVLHKYPNETQKSNSGKSHMLVAYYSSVNNSPPPAVKDLHKFLASKLPAYMVPTHFVHMKKIPLNKNGKIDRTSLPLPSVEVKDKSDATRVLPRTDMEQRMHKLVCALLRRECVGVTENLFEHGTDSILAVQFSIRIQQHFKTEILVKDIFQHPTIAGLSKLVECGLTGTLIPDDFDPYVDSMLPTDITPISGSSPNVKNPENIFLTGATGFIGGFLLAELLKNTDVIVHCLVRSDNESLGLIRIQSNLIKYGIWEREFEARIKVRVGNLASPQLGLVGDDYDWLCGNVEVIYHCAAPVNFILSYTAVRQETVEGTIEMLRLACKDKVKALHFVSSIAVHGLKDVNTSELKHENENVDHTELQLPDMGYARMKWVSEKLVRAAGHRGLPVTILRPSFVIGHTLTGAISTSEYISRLIKGCIQLGSFPDLRTPMWLVPIDYVVKAMLKITTNAENLSCIFHLTPDPQKDVSCTDIMMWVRDCGYTLHMKSYDEWYKEFKQNTEENHDNALFPLLQFVKQQLDTQNSLNENKISVGFDNTNTRQALKETDVAFQAVDWKFINKMVLYLTKEGFLSPPLDGRIQATSAKKLKTKC